MTRCDLIRQLSPGRVCCSRCRRFLREKDAEVDHVNGRDWQARNLSSATRVRRYVAEHAAGVPLRVLCRSCNARTGGGLRYAQKRP